MSLVTGKKRLGWALFGAVVLAFWAWDSPLDGGVAADGEPAGREHLGDQAAPKGRFAVPAERETIGGRAGELFAARSWKPPTRPRVRAPLRPAPLLQPTVPAMPYRVAGEVTHDGVSHLVLAKGNQVLTVRPGEILEDGYQVESISAEAVTLVYLPLGVREHVPVTWALASSTAPSGR